MSDRSESSYRQMPDGTGGEAGLENRLATGSDDSAGIATRIFSGVLLALVFPWVITRRVVTRGVPRVAHLLRGGSAATAKVVGRGAHWLAQVLAFIGSRLSSAARPLADLGGRCWQAVSRSSRLIADWAGLAGRCVRAAIHAAAGPAAVLVSWVSSALAAAARAVGAGASRCGQLLEPALVSVGRAIVWLIRLVASGCVAVLRRTAVAVGAVVGAVVHAVVTVSAALGRGASWGAKTSGHLVQGALASVGRAIVWLLRPAASGCVAVLHRAAAVVGPAVRAVVEAVATMAAVLGRGASWCAAPIGALLKRGLVNVGAALSLCVSAAAWAALVALRLLGACFKLSARGLAGAGRLAWTAMCWTWRRLLDPCAGRIGSVLLAFWRRLGAPLIGTIGGIVSRVATAVGHASAVASTLTGRVVRQTVRRLSVPIGSVTAVVRARRRVASQAALVAFATARHQARTAGLSASAGDADWRAAIPQAGGQAESDDQSIASIFTTESFQNAFLAPGESQVSAIVSVSAEHSGSARTDADAVELFLVDCSASMGHPWEKIQAARNATRAAVETLRDGVWFAVVRGAESAEVVYPRREGLVQASPETKRAAVKAIGALQPVGGTAIGRWLALAADLVSLRPHAMHHAILLTDGKDEDETESELGAAIARCEGLFQCDCRGVGTDWAVSELRKISTALLGSLDIIRDPAAMEADFRLMTEAAMTRQLELSLRIWTPKHARINFVRQVSPSILDLTPRERAAGQLVTDYLTGAWGTERREYHVSVDVRPGQVGAEMLASRISVIVRNKVVAKALVKAIWTEDVTLTAPLSPEVTHYAGQAELARAIQEGLEARRDRDDGRAAVKLGRAAQLAAESGNDAIAGLIANVVDVVDSATGTVRMRKAVDLSDEMALDTRSTKTVRISSTARPRESGTTSGA